MRAETVVPSSLRSVLRPHSTEVTQVAACQSNPDVTVTSSSDTTCKVFNRGSLTATITTPTTQPLTCCDAVDDLVVTGCVDKSVRVYRAARGGKPKVQLQGHGGKVVDVMFLGGAKAVVSASQDRR